MYADPPGLDFATIERVAILRALKVGDLLCSVPAFRALRYALPRAEITLIGLPWARSFVERFDCYLDRFLEFPGYPGLPERPPDVGEIPRFLSRAREYRYDLAIQMHGSGSIVNPLVVLLGARATAGFYVPGDYCPDERRFLPYPDDGLEVHRHLRLMEFLGVALQGEHLEFPLGADDWRALRAIDEAGELRPGEYVCIHPGASVPHHRWPPRHFAEVADALAARGYRIVLTGTPDEAPLARAVGRMMRAQSIDLAGRTGLGSLGALLSGARLVVSNDTGVSHLAAALRVPSVIVSTGAEPARWAPLDRERHRVLCPAEIVLPSEVLFQAEALLAEPVRA